MKFLAIDLEMTGLDRHEDFLLEVGAILLDEGLNELGRFTSVRDDLPMSTIVQQIKDPFVMEMHLKSGLLDAISRATQDKLGEYWVRGWAQTGLKNLIGPVNTKDPIVLLGCSVHGDRAVLEEEMPSFVARLSHKHLDCSSLLLCHKLPFLGPPGRAHRAIADAEEAVYLARQYRNVLKRVAA